MAKATRVLVGGTPSGRRALAVVSGATANSVTALHFTVFVGTYRPRLIHGIPACPADTLPKHQASQCVARLGGGPCQCFRQQQTRPTGLFRAPLPRLFASAAVAKPVPNEEDDKHIVKEVHTLNEEDDEFVFQEMKTKRMKRHEKFGEKLGSVAEPKPGDPYPFAYPPIGEEDNLYRFAMQTLERNKAHREKAAAMLEKEFNTVVAEGTPESREKARDLQTQVEAELVRAENNFPEVEWNFFHGRYDLRKPVYRHLFRKTLSEEVEFMLNTMQEFRVINDLLPVSAFSRINARVELSFAGKIPRYLQEIYRNHPQRDRTLYKMSAPQNPNVKAVPLYRAFVSPRFLVAQPTVRVTSLAPEEKLYTLLLVDCDDPYPEENTYRERCHWLVTNIPIGMLTCEYGPLPADAGDQLLSYIPPHPQRGTEPHRYTLLVMEQPGEIGADILENDNVEQCKASRIIDLIPLIKRNKLIIRGATGFRSVWDESVLEIYKEFLGEGFEPVYGVINEDPSIGPDGRPYLKVANS